MTIRPGPNAVRLAAGLTVLSLLMLVTTQMVWLLLAGLVAGLVVAVCDYFAIQRRFSRVHVVRRHPAVVGRGQSFELAWRVSSSAGAALAGELRDQVPNDAQPRFVVQRFLLPASTSAAEESLVLQQSLRLPLRGAYSIGPLWLRLPGPGGFLDGQQLLPECSRIRVLPETFASPDRFRKEMAAELQLLDRPVFTRQQGDGTEFESLREYRTGDDPRRIDWRATARLRRPIVRKFQIERHRDILIAVDCGRLMGGQVAPGGRLPDTDRAVGAHLTRDRGTKLDCAIDSALLLGRVALQGGDRCGFSLFDHRVRAYLPPVAGASALPALVDCVYDAQVDWNETDFSALYATLQSRQAKRSLLIVLSDLLDAATSEQYRGLLRRLAQRHIVLFAALRTPLLNTVLEQPLDDFTAAARQAVVYRLLRDRESALQSLRHAGLTVLDVEPQQLTAPLINQFVTLRHSNRL